MVSRGRARAGVTLIELLVAVTLVSLLSAAMLMAIRAGLNALERTNAQLLANRRVLGAQRALDQQIAGLMPVAAVCGGAGQAARGVAMIFFQGDPRSMRFLSSYSLEEAGRGYPRILEYAVIPGREAGVRLIVNEHPYAGRGSLGMFCLGEGADPITGARGLRFRPVEPTPRSFVLADQLAQCRFVYQVRHPSSGALEWRAAHSGPQPPAAIRIEITPLEADASRVRMGTVTVPVRVSRDAQVEYKDIDDEEPR
jgi:prepilin-type N-terminal cleavage/methylation domain-containing protein